MTARILITGSRDFTAAGVMHDALAQAVAELGPGATLVHGAARGADHLADTLAPTLGLTVERWPAAWDLWGRSAGFKRNQTMVGEGADVCLAFLVDWARCNGTRDCARRASRAGIPVRWFTQEAR